MQVSNNLREELKEKYNIFAENKQAVKDLNAANTELIKEIAEKYQVKSQEVRDAFKFAQKLEESGHDSLDAIVDIFENLKGDSSDND